VLPIYRRDERFDQRSVLRQRAADASKLVEVRKSGVSDTTQEEPVCAKTLILGTTHCRVATDHWYW
jgi:hypothetical protein